MLEACTLYFVGAVWYLHYCFRNQNWRQAFTFVITTCCLCHINQKWDPSEVFMHLEGGSLLLKWSHALNVEGGQRVAQSNSYHHDFTRRVLRYQHMTRSTPHPNLHQQSARLAHNFTNQNQNEKVLDNASCICAICACYPQSHCKSHPLSNLSNLRTFWMYASTPGPFGTDK